MRVAYHQALVHPQTFADTLLGIIHPVIHESGALMYPTNSPTETRELVLRVFQQRLAGTLDRNDLEERARIDDGRVVAYCYRAEGLMAMWMVDRGLLQFYDQNGEMLNTIDIRAPETKSRKAA